MGVDEGGSLRTAAAVRGAARWKILPILEIVALLFALILPVLAQDYLTVFATRVLILSLFAISFDLMWGYAGIMSFGQALFFGSAGYAVALLARDAGITSIFVVLPTGTLVGLLLSIVIGAFLLLGRNPSSEVFISIGALVFAYSAERLARGWYYVGGGNGVSFSDSMTIGSYELSVGSPFYYFALGVLVTIYFLCRFLVRSQFGLALAGLRENQQRIAFFGYKVQHLKTIMFTLGGSIAGLAGSINAYHEGFVFPVMLGVVTSTQVVLYVLFGGAGTLIGAVLGTAMIEAVSFWLADSYKDVWPIILGVLLLLVIMFRPTGLIGLVLSERERGGSFGRPSQRSRDAAP